MNGSSFRLRAVTPTLPALAFSGLIVLASAAVARQSSTALLLLAPFLAVSLCLIVAELQRYAIGIWLALAGVLYPYVQVPKGHPLVTFDRAWVLPMVACLVLTTGQIPFSRATRNLVIWLAALTAALGLSALASSNVLSAVGAWIDALVLPGILLLVSRALLQTREQCRRVAGAFVLAGLVLAVIGIAETIFGFNLAVQAGGEVRIDYSVTGVQTLRLSGPYPVPEMYALSLVVCLAASLYWVQARGRRAYPVGGVVIAIEVTAVALTFFRAAWISGLVVIILALGLRPKRYGRLVTVAALVAALLYALSGQLANRQVSARVSDRNNIYGRLATYSQGLQIFRSHFFTGVGLNNYFTTAQSSPIVTVSGVEAEPYPHSTYINTLAEEGLMGFVPLLAATIAVFRLIGILRRRARLRDDVVLAASVAGAALGYLIMSLTLTMLPYGPSNAFFFLFLGLACSRADLLEVEASAPNVAQLT